MIVQFGLTQDVLLALDDRGEVWVAQNLHHAGLAGLAGRVAPKIEWVRVEQIRTDADGTVVRGGP